MLERHLTVEELATLLATAKRDSSLLAQRDYHWLSFLRYSALRIKEFSLLTRGDAEAGLKLGRLYIPAAHRKGKRSDHSVFLTLPMRQHLQALLGIGLQLGGDSDALAPLVVSREGGMSVRSYQHRMRQWCQKAGLTVAASPHWLRHTRALEVVRNSTANDALRITQRVLGHASLASTGIYAGATREELESTLTKIDGGGRVSRKKLRDDYQRRAA